MRSKIGVQLYPVRNGRGNDFDGVIVKIRDMFNVVLIRPAFFERREHSDLLVFLLTDVNI